MLIVILVLATVLLNVTVDFALLTVLLGRVRMKALLNDVAIRHGIRPYEPVQEWPEQMPPCTDDYYEDEADPYAGDYDDSDYHLENFGC